MAQVPGGHVGDQPPGTESPCGRHGLGGPDAPADSGELGWSVTMRLGAEAATLVANDTDLSPAPEGRMRLIPGSGTGSGDGLWSLSYRATPVTEGDDHVEIQFAWPRLGMEPCAVSVPVR